MLTPTGLLLVTRALEFLLAISLGLQTLEFLRLSEATSAHGLWAWSVQRRDIPQAWLSPCLDALMLPSTYKTLLWLRLVAALCLGLWGGSLALVLFLFAGTVLILIRWRGAFNGGSDFMTLVVLTGLLIAYVGGEFVNPALAWRAGLWYITLQAVTSYFMSGWVKMLRPEWRSGAAMTIFLNAAIYGPLSPKHWLRQPGLACFGAWSFMLWEATFPLALLHPLWALLYCSVAAVFHLFVFWFFGLNRFFWAWLATFPAIVGCSVLWI